RYSRRWTTAGQSARLLSLDGRLMTFTGGAPPNHGADALLWDRSTRAEVRAASLFSSNEALDRLVRVPGCAILDSERAKRRGATIKRGGAFADCPALAALTLVLTDANRNRRFDHVRLVAAHAGAGSYSEGSSDISLPITATLLAAIKPAYRASFEVGQPQ
ncbi:MAG: hypothetical protein M3Q15_02275, partial [Pseudomonadota bacterium]|nr:hypothetical protein [Pseudomonadota bacterium]